MKQTNALTEVLDMFAEIVASKIAPLLAARADCYGTNRAATLPPGKTRAWALRKLKTIPGAHKIGRDWVVSVSDFYAWVEEQETSCCARAGTAVSKASNMSSSPTVAERAERSLVASGFRRTRR